MRLLHLASTLGPTGSAKHLALVAPDLARDGFEQLVVNFGDAKPFGDRLSADGVRVESVKFRGLFDVSSAVKLRRLARAFVPDVLHVWGNRAAALANLLRAHFGKTHPIHVASDLRPVHGHAVERTRTAAKVVRDSAPLLDPTPSPALPLTALGLPASARMIVNGGGFDTTSDQRMAVSAFDIIKYTIPDIHLAVVGDGPDFAKVHDLAHAIGYEDFRTHFLGVRADVPAILATAAVVVITHRQGGKTTALETVTAGVPVVAWNTPDLAALIVDGETGLLVPPGDRAALASAMYRVLTTPELAAKLGQGTAKPREQPAPASAAAAWAKIYRSFKT